MLLVIHAALLFIGGATVITMLLFYGLAAWIFVKAINYMTNRYPIKPQTSRNIRMMIISTTIALIVAELFLRYVNQDFKSYGELNGNFIYSSERINNWDMSLIGFKQNWIHTNDAFEKVSYHSKEFSYPGEHYNSLGLREAEFTDTEDIENLVIGLGDSFTEGVGAPYDSVWLRQMTQILKSEYKYSLTTLNAGVEASDPLYEYMLLQYKLKDFKPELVIVAINNTDIDDIVSRGGFERFGKDSLIVCKKPHWWEYVYSFSFIIRNVVHKLCKIDRQFLTTAEQAKEKVKAREIIVECIEKFKEYSIQQKFKLLLVFHPLAFELQNHHFELEGLCRSADSLGVSYVNLYSWYLAHGINRDNVYDYYWKADLHHNPMGYGLWARAVSEKIIRDKLIN